MAQPKGKQFKTVRVSVAAHREVKKRASRWRRSITGQAGLMIEQAAALPDPDKKTKD